MPNERVSCSLSRRTRQVRNCHLLTIKRTPLRKKDGGKENGEYKLISKQTETNIAPTQVADMICLLFFPNYTRLQGRVFLFF